MKLKTWFARSLRRYFYNNPCTFFSLLLMTTTSTFNWIKWWLVITHKLRIWSSILIQFSLYILACTSLHLQWSLFCYVLFSFVKVMLELSFMCKYLCINVMHNNGSVFFLAQLHHPCNFSSQSGSCNIWCNKDFTWSWPKRYNTARNLMKNVMSSVVFEYLQR
jgi:hypothetical protein